MHARRPTYALVAAIVFWLPMMKRFIFGEVDVFPAALQFLLLFVFAWLAVTVVAMITEGYGKHTPVPRRRKTDPPGPDAIPEPDLPE